MNTGGTLECSLVNIYALHPTPSIQKQKSPVQMNEQGFFKMAPEERLELPARWLTATCSTN